MGPQPYNYMLRQGQLMREQFNFFIDGSPVNLVDFWIESRIYTPGRAVALVVFSKEEGNVVEVPGRRGSFQLVLSASQTRALPAGDYRHWLNATRIADEQRFKLIEGDVEVQEALE